MTSPEPIDSADFSVVPLQSDGWVRWLQQGVDQAWRPGEWSQETWLFEGDKNNPRTATAECRTAVCWTLIPAGNAFCRHCVDVFAVSGLSHEEFAATYQRPPLLRAQRGSEPLPCLIERRGSRCERPAYTRGLCRAHYYRWYHQSGDVDRLEEWAVQSDVQPMAARPPCIAPGCLNQRLLGDLCSSHHTQWERAKRQGTHLDVASWAREAAPVTRGNQFCLRQLAETLRWEILYGLQQRDARGAAIYPVATRNMLRRLADLESLLAIDQAAVEKRFSRDNNMLGAFREIVRTIRLASLSFRGLSPTDGDVWELSSVGLKSSSFSGRRQTAGTADFTQIRQAWLREPVKVWARSSSPDNEKFKRMFYACVVASDALHAQPGGGLDLTRLRFADMQAVFTAMCRLRRRDSGELATRGWRLNCFSAFLDMLDFGRKTDLLIGLPGGFGRDKSFVLPPEETNEDAAGKSVPEPVIAQLDARLDLLGATFSYGGLARDDIQLMIQTAYQILRDTGRRPVEVTSLQLRCLQIDSDEHTLIWDNHKKRRYNRRLPVSRETAEVIRIWQARRNKIRVPSRSSDFLFPAITDRSGYKHMTSASLATSMRQWVTAIPELLSDELDDQGNRLLFDRTLIFPYAFRHSYAQRHADAGVPPDVLKELMDHRMISTTMTYYQVSMKRKREAVTAMQRHVVNRKGQPAPFTSTTDYEAQSVAVPFGNCREPSNVKAGGKACPIRFQCAGCGFYRPDPSYLPAIEEHINALRADRETAMAMDTDAFVVRNLADQIAAFSGVSDSMREKLANLPDDERAEIEKASTVLRKVRATRDHKLLPLSVVQKGRPDNGT
ncbi:site-specific integrase [Streptomyces phaeochromogenes]|uniref:tyrosine-type recombinase/integrase n=1 Tax=Streptomyces phaeochromogenes TaxID=1923 RepID=UPI0038659EF6|nr:site-specific integrase [Streptomyces phaeochromogenes]WSS99045.1 site-specific integrase [Streptomyces phaeochromogenes]